MKNPFISLDFFFQNQEVGFFETLSFPSKDGGYSYMPYRGLGHHEMQQAFIQKGFADCYYINGNHRVSFRVEPTGEYRKLILSEFSKEFIQK